MEDAMSKQRGSMKIEQTIAAPPQRTQVLNSETRMRRQTGSFPPLLLVHGGVEDLMVEQVHPKGEVLRHPNETAKPCPPSRFFGHLRYAVFHLTFNPPRARR